VVGKLEIRIRKEECQVDPSGTLFFKLLLEVTDWCVSEQNECYIGHCVALTISRVWRTFIVLFWTPHFIM